MKRFLHCFLAVAAAIAVANDSSHGGERPNVVFIISDDHAWTDYGFMGSKEVRTPNLDRLAAGSLTYSRGYVTTALCSPSLATMLTGLHPHQHGITGNDPHDPSVEKAWLSKKPELRVPFVEQFLAKPQLPRLLSEAGYLTLHTGKFWMGTPAKVGFTHDMGETGRHGGRALAIGRKTMEPIYDFIDEAQATKKPFFVWYAPFLPHAPHTPPERLLRNYADIEDRAAAKYLAMVEWLDETCGQLLEHLEKKSLTQNTLIVYIADNGWNEYGKGSPYENGVRTPILLRWPGRIKPESDDRNLATNYDLMPTILKACGVEMPDGLPGIDLLDRDAAAKRDAVFLSNFGHDMLQANRPELSLDSRTVIRGDWKLISKEKTPSLVPPYQRGRTPKNEGDLIELYRLTEDPHETVNRAADKPELVTELQSVLDAWWSPEAR